VLVYARPTANNNLPKGQMSDYTFDKWLRRKRQERGWTGPELALKSGVSKQVINSIERQTPHPITQAPYRPKVGTVDKLANALGGPLAEARHAAGFASDEDKSGNMGDVEVQRLTHYFKELPRECQLDTLALVEALWRRRRALWRAEQSGERRSGKHRPQTVKPGVERKSPTRKVG
jgi:transcriptional regulator with XRE-family HTH domain